MKIPATDRGNRKRPYAWKQISVVVSTLFVVAAACVLGWLSSRETIQMATEQFNRQQLMLARSAAVGIESYFKELTAALVALAQLPSVQQILPEALECMQHTYSGFPTRTSIRLLDGDGVLQLIYPFENWRGELIGLDYSGEAYFQQVRETPSAVTSGSIINEQGEARIRVAVPVYLTHRTETVRLGDATGTITVPIEPPGPEAAKLQAVIVGSFDPSIIAQAFISPIVSGKTGYAWLLDAEGIFLAHHEEEFIGLSSFDVRAQKNQDISYAEVEQIQQRMMAGEEGMDWYVSGWHRGELGEIKKLVAYTPISINGSTWSVAVCAPIDEVEEIVSITRRAWLYTLGFVILVLILAGVFLFAVSYRWAHTLEREVARQTRKLRETSSYLGNLIKYANAPVVVWGLDERVTIFNKAFEEMTGRTETEMLGQTLGRLFPEESRADALEKTRTASKGDNWDLLEVECLGKDGETRVGLWNSAVIYAEDGNTPIAVIAQGQDITERRHIAKVLRQSEQFLSDVFSSIQDGVTVINADLRILKTNEMMERWYGEKLPLEGSASNAIMIERNPAIPVQRSDASPPGNRNGELWPDRRVLQSSRLSSSATQ